MHKGGCLARVRELALYSAKIQSLSAEWHESSLIFMCYVANWYDPGPVLQNCVRSHRTQMPHAAIFPRSRLQVATDISVFHTSSFLRRLLYGSLFLLLFLSHHLPFHRRLTSPHILCYTNVCGPLWSPLLLFPFDDRAFVVHSFCYF